MEKIFTEQKIKEIKEIKEKIGDALKYYCYKKNGFMPNSVTWTVSTQRECIEVKFINEGNVKYDMLFFNDINSVLIQKYVS